MPVLLAGERWRQGDQKSRSLLHNAILPRQQLLSSGLQLLLLTKDHHTGLADCRQCVTEGMWRSLEPSEVSSHRSHSSHPLNSVLICMWPGVLGRGRLQRLGRITGRRIHLHSCGEAIIHTGCRLYSILSPARYGSINSLVPQE